MRLSSLGLLCPQQQAELLEGRSHSPKFTVMQGLLPFSPYLPSPGYCVLMALYRVLVLGPRLDWDHVSEFWSPDNRSPWLSPLPSTFQTDG